MECADIILPSTFKFSVTVTPMNNFIELMKDVNCLPPLQAQLVIDVTSYVIKDFRSNFDNRLQVFVEQLPSHSFLDCSLPFMTTLTFLWFNF